MEVAGYMFELQAQEAKLLLESKGIDVSLENAIMSQINLGIADAGGGVKVMVRKEDATRAAKILEKA